jgi:hypothetical protein
MKVSSPTSSPHHLPTSGRPSEPAASSSNRHAKGGQGWPAAGSHNWATPERRALFSMGYMLGVLAERKLQAEASEPSSSAYAEPSLNAPGPLRGMPQSMPPAPPVHRGATSISAPCSWQQGAPPARAAGQGPQLHGARRSAFRPFVPQQQQQQQQLLQLQLLPPPEQLLPPPEQQQQQQLPPPEQQQQLLQLLPPLEQAALCGPQAGAPTRLASVEPPSSRSEGSQQEWHAGDLRHDVSELLQGDWPSLQAAPATVPGQLAGLQAAVLELLGVGAGAPAGRWLPPPLAPLPLAPPAQPQLQREQGQQQMTGQMVAGQLGRAHSLGGLLEDADALACPGLSRPAWPAPVSWPGGIWAPGQAPLLQYGA